jgi:hypothetical protein
LWWRQQIEPVCSEWYSSYTNDDRYVFNALISISFLHQLTCSTAITSGTATSSLPTPTGPITVANVTGWNYLGCYSEATTGRALNGLLLPITAANTEVETCAAACSKFAYFGVEYGQECKSILKISGSIY